MALLLLRTQKSGAQRFTKVYASNSKELVQELIFPDSLYSKYSLSCAIGGCADKLFLSRTFFFFFFKFTYLFYFIFGCVGSSFLCEGFL